MGVPASAAARYAPIDAPGPPASASAADLAASVHCTANVRNAKREPVVLLSATGVDTDDNFSWNYEPALAAAGIPFCTSDQPGRAATNTGDIQQRGDYIVHAIRYASRLSGRRVAVLGHSQGGMAMRWALRFWPDTRPLVEDVIGMAGSNHGSTESETCAHGCTPADFQQQAGTDFEAALNSRQETFVGIDYTEVYTHLDATETPNADDTGVSSVHGPGRITNVATQDVCPANTADHLTIGTTDPVTYALVIDALGHRGPASPSRIDAAACAQEAQPPPGKARPVVAADFPPVTAEPPLACYVNATCGGPPAELAVSVSPRRPAAGKATTLTVTVRDSRAGETLAGARVHVRGATAVTDLRGRARLRVVPSSGGSRLTTRLAGYPLAVTVLTR